MFATRWIDWIDAHDRGLRDRWAIVPGNSAMVRRGWIALTWCGSAGVTIGAVLLPPLIVVGMRGTSMHAAVALASSHLAVQLIKRRVNRARPTTPAIIACPDRFSFPSGHAAASLAVALAYAVAMPALALPLALFGMLVGWSRVALGVHYPADVIAGQLLACGGLVTALLLR